ncbi:hypothetical protein DL767_010456 [Monosporascus sp. MG133]|nr:hypothetical protein DL767_010456 [Monosporascus sp. MG133]
MADLHHICNPTQIHQLPASTRPDSSEAERDQCGEAAQPTETQITLFLVVAYTQRQGDGSGAYHRGEPLDSGGDEHETARWQQGNGRGRRSRNGDATLLDHVSDATSEPESGALMSSSLSNSAASSSAAAAARTSGTSANETLASCHRLGMGEAGASRMGNAFRGLAKGQSRCLVCGDILENAGASAGAFKMLHAEKRLLKERFPCPICTRENPSPCGIAAASSFYRHGHERSSRSPPLHLPVGAAAIARASVPHGRAPAPPRLGTGKWQVEGALLDIACVSGRVSAARRGATGTGAACCCRPVAVSWVGVLVAAGLGSGNLRRTAREIRQARGHQAADDHQQAEPKNILTDDDASVMLEYLNEFEQFPERMMKNIEEAYFVFAGLPHVIEGDRGIYEHESQAAASANPMARTNEITGEIPMGVPQTSLNPFEIGQQQTQQTQQTQQSQIPVPNEEKEP